MSKLSRHKAILELLDKAPIASQEELQRLLRRRKARWSHSRDACLMSAKLKIAVLGATGYSGLELTRLLLRHPRVQKPVLLRRSENRETNKERLPHPSRFSKGGNSEANEINL